MGVQRIALSILYIVLFVGNVFSQGGDGLENIFRLNFINPALEYEKKTGDYSVISGAAGIGYGGSYRELEIQGNGFVYIISPFVDIQYKLFYNRKKRVSKGKSILYNSGNYVSLRGITRFLPLTENVVRTDKTDFAIGPTWGLQRSFGKIHFLFDIGPQYYFDTKGNGGFFPIMVQINIGLNLSPK
ncbi:hypothetical protein Murru_2930 [Allomuricauda ruestringensis DSM 13258]|uniref:Uncharacterized protein n=1 Tax=Allomuricauda ruestringensis (strain DSM 13258 / CIP 107369 / LMG 19739 / B1) TaxID=886377 RepID=G2PJK2_ALLRU|nr:hypothetical protein [Allomuricauda ruestringensis]AEM71952.1 hypothetical protein Murru_2930 [Allomuricauda ruestringensis DSM 13258]